MTKRAMTWLAASAALASEGAMLKTDFEGGSLPEGWETNDASVLFRPGEGLELAPGAGVAKDGGRPSLRSPPIPIRPFQYAACDFTVRAEGAFNWTTIFYDREGNALAADSYDRLEGAAGWRTNRFCIRGHAQAAGFRLAFMPDGGPLVLGRVAVEETDAAGAAAWADGVAAGFPAVAAPAAGARDDRLPRTMKILREGGRLRIVMLGDSICNDTSKSLFETLLMRRYPKARIEVVTSVKGATGCWYYKRRGQLKSYVFQYEPDLTVIAGISHHYDAEAIRSVVRQIRKQGGSEVLVVSGAISPEAAVFRGFQANPVAPKNAAALAELFPGRLRAMTEDEAVAFLDMRAEWERAVPASGRPNAWFQRDAIHGNTAGKQLAGRILARYFD
jgi:hypothetical protein